MPPQGMSVRTGPVPTASVANLKAGDLSGFERDAKGRITTSRSEMGRKHALDILSDPKYQKSLKERMIAGEGGAIEVWIWRIGYGDPPRAKEDDGEDRARFDRRREAMQKFMREHPREAAILAQFVAKGEEPPAEIKALLAGGTPPPEELVPCELVPDEG